MGIKKAIFIAGFFLLTAVHCLMAEEQPMLKFDHLSVEQGLSHGAVTSILQDATGYLWFGTWEGLNRYDGYDTQVYLHQTDDSLSISGNAVWSLYEDSAGRMWVGTYNRGVNLYNRHADQFHHYLTDRRKDCSAFCIYEDPSGVIWIGSEGGLYQYQEAEDTFQYFPIPDSIFSGEYSAELVYSIVEHQNVLWAGTRTGLLRFNRQTGDYSHEAGIDAHVIMDLFVDRSDCLWLGTEYEGAFRLEPQNRGGRRWKVHHYNKAHRDPFKLNDFSVYQFYETRSGDIWMATLGGGLNILNMETGSITYVTADPDDSYSLSQNEINTIYEDRSGVLWFATGGKGLDKLDTHGKPFQHYLNPPFNHDKLHGNNVWAVHEDSRGSLWLGTKENGLIHFDRQTRTCQVYQNDGTCSSLYDNRVHAIIEDDKGNLWLGLNNGLDHFDPHKGSFTHYSDTSSDIRLSSNHIYALCRDREGLLWIGSWENGVDVLNTQTGEIRNFQHDPADSSSLCHNCAAVIYEDRRGSIWVGTWGGLSVYNKKTEQFVNYSHVPFDSSSLNSNVVRAVYEDSRGRLWIGTEGGLHLFFPDSGAFIRFTEDHGLCSNVVLGIVEDSAGNLWLSTHYGISCFNPETGHFRNFDYSDGLQGNLFNPGAAGLLRSGEIIFGGVNGVNVFFPERIHENPVPPEVVIHELKVSRKQVRAGDMLHGRRVLEKFITETDAVELDYRDNHLTFEFSALHFANPLKNQYAYQLAGFDDDWVHAESKIRYAEYANLSSGRYQFRVKASNPDGLWQHEDCTLDIYIRPPFWKTWWFYLLMIIGAVSCIYVIVRIRTHAISKQAEVLNRQVEERTEEIKTLQYQILQQERMAALGQLIATVAHEIRNPLGTIRASIFSIDDALETDNHARARRAVQLAEKNVLRCNEIISELLDYIRDRNVVFSAVEVDAFVREAAESHLKEQTDLLTFSGIRVSYDLKAGMKVKMDEISLRRALVNLMDNAVQAMQENPNADVESSLKISTVHRGEHCLIAVSDNGPGISEDQKEQIFEPFYSSKSFGVGLGLAIVQKIMKQHKGELQVESVPYEKTRFTLVLPL